MAEQGFDDAALESAVVFRAILEVMARPGTILKLASSVCPPEPLCSTAAAIALTLADYDTPLWLDSPLRTSAIEDFLRFHTGAPLVTDPGACAFALVGDAASLHDLSSFRVGTHEYPDRSTTLLVLVAELIPSAGVRMKGPGIVDEHFFNAKPLGTAFWSQMTRNSTLFPRGIDVLFAAPTSIAACPRSTRLELEGVA